MYMRGKTYLTMLHDINAWGNPSVDVAVWMPSMKDCMNEVAYGGQARNQMVHIPPACVYILYTCYYVYGLSLIHI